ncbi:putative lipid II flippase FtsW [Candidatus Dependentiae bacterium Noda2021]|nr:putative lipid II flippase FtsW [Candidatus Dependentiae bacterium Noda2021]
MNVNPTCNQQRTSDLMVFCTIVTLLIVIGLIFIYSSSSVFALEKFGTSLYFVKKQLMGLLVGLGAFALARYFPLQRIKQYAPIFYILSLLLTALTLLPHFGIRIHGSSRWISLAGFAFQPSELLKITLILYVSFLITKKCHVVSHFWQRFVPITLILALASLVLLQQPDFGLTVTLMVTCVIIFFIAQYQMRYLTWSIAAAVPAVALLIVTSPYRVRRVLTFLNPWSDPQGSGFQIIQSLIAIGSGGAWGSGIAHSKQKFFYLPMQHTDFIFSIIAEEIGFVGSCIIIFAFMALLFFGIRLALKMKDPFCTYATLGFIIMMNIQTLINIAVATGLAPTKGIGLPFVSYGNTSLVGYLIIIGLIVNMTKNSGK